MRARNIQNTFSAADSRSKMPKFGWISFSVDVRAVPASCGRESVEVEAGGEANSSAGEQGRHSSSPLQRSTEAPSVGSDKKPWPNAFTTQNSPIIVWATLFL
jgi:hypothetical protein